MKCVLVGPTYPYRGGVAHYTTLLHRHLLQRGHEVTLLSFKRQYPGWLFPGRTDKDPSERPLCAECEYVLDPLNPLTWFATAQRIGALQPDLLILQWWVPYWAPIFGTVARWAKRVAPPKVLFICHNVLPHEPTLGAKFLAGYALRVGDGFIVHSATDGEKLQSILPDAVIHRTALPTYHGLCTDGVMDRNVAKSDLGLSGAVALFFGFVRPYKGLMVLLDALPQALARVKFHLLVVGEFWEPVEPYLERIERLGISDYVTIVNEYVANEELGRYFYAADVVVLPYVAATQSAVVQLAFGFGVPVITTHVGGLPEVVRDGETGLLVPPDDSEALAAAVVRFLESHVGSRMEHNLTKERDAFSWQQLTSLIEDLA